MARLSAGHPVGDTLAADYSDAAQTFLNQEFVVTRVARTPAGHDNGKVSLPRPSGYWVTRYPSRASSIRRVTDSSGVAKESISRASVQPDEGLPQL